MRPGPWSRERRDTGTSMSDNHTTARSPLPAFFLLPLSQRIVGLDVVRGFAIIAMTAYHQSLVIRPTGGWRLSAEVLGYASAPLFLVVSGLSAALHERRHRQPFRMIVHGALLFLMAYAIDLVLSRALRVDWDVFQVIGACYAALGLSGCLGEGPPKYLGWLALLSLLTWQPVLRPDRGLFPPWPFGLYFFGGYLLGQLGLRPWLNLGAIRGLASIGLGLLLLGFSWTPPPDRTQLPGFLFIFTLAGVLVIAALELGRRGGRTAPFLETLSRFGRYPLTLYFAQQLAAVARLRLPLPLPPNAAWLGQTALLLALMSAAALLIERHAVLDAGWWLRQCERLILKLAPAREPGSLR